MDPKRLNTTLQGARVFGGGGIENEQSFDLSLLLPRTCPKTNEDLSEELILSFEGVCAVALGLENPTEVWAKDATASCLTPWPFKPQIPDIQILEAPVGREVRALRGRLNDTRNATYRFGFGFESPATGREPPRVWLQIWAHSALLFGEEGMLPLPQLEREVSAGWQSFYDESGEIPETSIR